MHIGDWMFSVIYNLAKLNIKELYNKWALLAFTHHLATTHRLNAFAGQEQILWIVINDEGDWSTY